MHLLSLDGYNKIYSTDSFWKEYEALFGKNKKTYKKEKEQLMTSLDILNNSPLPECLQRPAIFESLSGEDLYVIRHVSQTNPRVIFVTSDEDGNYILLNSFLEKSKSDYDRAKKKAKGIIKHLEEA